MTNTNSQSPRRVVQIGDKYYTLLRPFINGATAIVWQAQPIPLSKLNEKNIYTDETDLAGKELLTTLHNIDNAQHQHDETLDTKLVAIKVPKSPDNFQDLRNEAKNLRQLRSSREHMPSNRLIEVIEDHSLSSDCPCLILAWASGVQIKHVKEIFSERTGLYIGLQIVLVVEDIFNQKFRPLNDSIKPDSVFWDEITRQITIIDLGLIGDKTAYLETQTLPILGDTLHKVLTGENSGSKFDENEVPLPDQLWQGQAEVKWKELSFGTRQIVQKLFDGSYLPQATDVLDAKALHSCLSQTIGAARSALENQINLWAEPDSDVLLQKARQAEPSASINHFDIAWGKGEIPTEEDKERYLAQWSALIWDWLENENYEASRFDIHWFHEYAPDMPLGQRAWIATEAALEDENMAWTKALTVLKQMEAGDIAYEDADYVKAAQLYSAAQIQIQQMDSPRLREIENDVNDLLLKTEKKASDAGLETCEQSFFMAVDSGQTNNITRNERAKFLKEALSSWHNIKNLQVGEQVGDYERRFAKEQAMFQMIKEQAYGDHQLNNYDNIVTWVATLKERATEKTDLIRSMEKWKKKQATYEQQMERYQQYSDDLQSIMQTRAKTVSKTYREANKQHNSTADLIKPLQEAIDAGFSFDLQGYSLHFALSMFLADLGRYAAATTIIEASRPVFEKILASTNADENQLRAWLSETETAEIEQYLNAIDEFAAQQQNMLRNHATTDVFQFHLAQQRNTQSSAPSYLTRLGLTQLLSGSSNQEILELQELSKEYSKDNRLALSYLSLALIADSTNETTKAYFDHLLDEWLDNERENLGREIAEKRRDLNENIVQKLEGIQAFTKLEQWLQLLQVMSVDQLSPATWLRCSDQILQLETLIVEMQTIEPVVEDSHVDNDEYAPSDLARFDEEQTIENNNPHLQKLTNISQFMGQVLVEQIDTVEQAALSSGIDDDNERLVDVLQKWEGLLPQLEEKFTNNQLNVPWVNLKNQVERSLQDAQRIAAIVSLGHHLQINDYQAAKQDYNNYQGFNNALRMLRG